MQSIDLKKFLFYKTKHRQNNKLVSFFSVVFYFLCCEAIKAFNQSSKFKMTLMKIVQVRGWGCDIQTDDQGWEIQIGGRDWKIQIGGWGQTVI